jgi:lysyl-tRNA synthetase class 1
VPRYQAKVNFSVVNNLISALGTDSADLLMDYLGRYDDQVFDYPQVIQSLIEKGLSYYRDTVLPTKTFRHPSGDERVLLGQLRQRLALCGNVDEDALQAIPFDVAKESGVEPRDLFRTVYEILLGQERGPRFGSFVKLVGKERVLEMLDDLGPGARQVPVL